MTRILPFAAFAALAVSLTAPVVARADLPTMTPGAACSPIKNSMSPSLIDNPYTGAGWLGGFHIPAPSYFSGGTFPAAVCPIPKARADARKAGLSFSM